jgi:hypothetical protein
VIRNVSTFRSKSIVRNSVICTDATELEGFEWEFVALCCSRFLHSGGKVYSYTNALQLLSLRTLHDRRHQPDEIFVINGFWCSKSCPSSTDIIGLIVPSRKLRDFPPFHIRPFSKNCPSARCVRVANSVCSDFGIIKKHINTLRFDIIFSFISQCVLMNYSCTCVCFIHVLVTVRCLCMLCLFCYGPQGSSFRGLMNRIRT